ncbi:MAG: hypothetical protein WCF47_24570, partial [Pseudolabrys sp.]
LGGSADIFSSGFGFGSDAINTGHNAAGNGGSGHFSGSLSDTSVAIYAPINIAIAGYGSVDDAFKANHVHLDPSAIAMAALGGDGGHGNLALGGDVAAHLLPEHHLLLG